MPDKPHKCTTFCGLPEFEVTVVTSFVDFSARQRQTYGFALLTRDESAVAELVLSSTVVRQERRTSKPST